MSPPRSPLLLLGLNLVLTVLVVSAALTFLAPEPPPPAPADTAPLEAALEAVRQETAALGDRIDALELESRAQAARVEELARGARGSEASGAAALPGGPPGEPPAAAPAPEEAVQKAFGALIRRQAKRARDRYLRELLNPTPDSEERQRRRIARVTETLAGALGLAERDRDAVERILTEVDRSRRAKLKDLVERKADPEQVTFEEVKGILDESFAEEDRLVAESLPEEQAARLRESAEPFRQMILLGARVAFAPEQAK